MDKESGTLNYGTNPGFIYNTKPAKKFNYLFSGSNNNSNNDGLSKIFNTSTNYIDSVKNLSPLNITGTNLTSTGTNNSGFTFYPGEDIYYGQGTDKATYWGHVANPTNNAANNSYNNGMGELGWNQGTLALGLGTLNWLTNLGFGLYGMNKASKLANKKLAIDATQVDDSSTSFNDGHVASGLTALAMGGGRDVVGEAAADNQLTNTINSQTRDTNGNRTFSYNANTNKISANA